MTEENRLPGGIWTSTLEGATSGEALLWSVALLDADTGAVVIAGSASAFEVDPPSTNFKKTFVLPAAPGRYQAEWTKGGEKALDEAVVEVRPDSYPTLARKPGEAWTTDLVGGVPGDAASWSVALLNADTGAVVIAASGAGVIEVDPTSGNFRKTLVLPATHARYQAEWIHGGRKFLDDAIVEVTLYEPGIVTVVVAPEAGPGRTFLDLQDEALHDDFDAAKYRARVKQWLNEAERKIFRLARVPEGEWTDRITTTAGVAELDLDVSVIRFNSLRNTTDRDPLEEVSIESIDDAATATGKPAMFALNGSKLTLYPTPGAAYSLEARYQSRPSVMVEDGDRPQLIEDYQDMLVTYARSRLFRAEGDTEMANYFRSEFDSDLQLLRRDVGRRSRRRRRRVPGMFVGDAAEQFVRPGR